MAARGRHFLVNFMPNAWADGLSSQMSGQEHQETAPGEGQGVGDSKLPLLATAPSPAGKGREGPPTCSKPALLTAACPHLSSHCFHVHGSFSNFGAQQNLLGSLFEKAQAQVSPKKNTKSQSSGMWAEHVLFFFQCSQVSPK